MNDEIVDDISNEISGALVDRDDALRALEVAIARARAAEAERDSLQAELAQYNLGEWEDDRLREWLPDAASRELVERLNNRAENNWRDYQNAQDELERLEAELARLREGEGWRPMEGEPPTGRIQVRTTARARSRVVFKALGETEIGRVHCLWNPDNDWEWRPHPDATRTAEADRDAIRDDLAEEEI